MFNFLANTIGSFDIKSIFSNIKTDLSFYIVLFYAVVVFAMFCLYIKPKQTLSMNKTKKIALIAMLSALTVIANVFTFGPDKVKFSLVATACFIAGSMLGPMPGFAVGFIGDLIAGILAPQGIYNPILALSSGLWGFIPGVIFWYTKFNDYIKTIISFIISYLIASVLLNNFAIYMMYLYGVSKTTLYTYLSLRVPFTLLFTTINFVICIILLAPLKRIQRTLVVVKSKT